MRIRMRTRTRTRTAVLGVIGLVLVGCGGAQHPPAAGPVAPTGWVVHSISNPALRFAIPPDWHETPVAEVRKFMMDRLPSTSGDTRTALLGSVERIDAGTFRFVAVGRSSVQGWIASIQVLVETGDVSLEAAVARIEAWMRSHVPVDERPGDAHLIEVMKTMAASLSQDANASR